jgi:hypothetical protein
VSTRWKILLGLVGAVWGFFLVAIQISPKDAWEHLVAWWGVILSGMTLVAAGAIWLWKAHSVLIITQAILAAQQQLHRWVSKWSRRRRLHKKS